MSHRREFWAALALVLALPLTAQAAPEDCNAIVSMSQGAQVYAGDASGQFETAPSELEAMTSEQWMLLFKTGATLRYFSVAANWNNLAVRHSCGTNGQIDSVLLIFDPKLSQFPADLNSAISIMESRYPNAEINVSLLVGADNHVTCVLGGQNVSASRTHADFIDDMTMPEAGPDLDIPCSGYEDRIGHLTDAGALDAQAQVADWFSPSEPGLVIPDTIPHPGINGTNGFRIGVVNRDLPGLLWNAPYLYDTPYVEDSGWLAGDRIAYACAYAFLQWQGEIVGRVTFRAIPEASSYMQINDTYMDEGGNEIEGPEQERYYDGSPNPTGMQAPFGECPPVSESYEPADVPDERPNVVYYQGNTAIELRDYATTNALNGTTFDVVDVITEPFTVNGVVSGESTVNSRVSVLARFDDVPVAVVYYDGIGNGQVLVEG